jgi:hypothetical protein
MTNRDRIIVFAVGFVLGMLLVSVILQRRTNKEAQRADPWAEHNAAAIKAGAEPLPDMVPEVIRHGKIIDFGYVESGAGAQQRVWHLNFKQSYPYVRVSEDLESGVLKYMAADQILIKLSDGVDVTQLKPMLDGLNLRLRMFNRKERIAVIGVLNTDLDAVPKTIEAVKPYADLFLTVGPDFIEFK